MMQNMGKFEYSETLPCTGQLIVNPDGWYINYTFAGPDLRYKVHTIRIDSSEVESHIQALELAWKKYLELKQEYTLTQDKQDLKSVTFKPGIYIHLGYQYMEGISIASHSQSKMIQSEDYLQEVIQGLRYSIKKAKMVMTMLKTVENHLRLKTIRDDRESLVE